MKNCNKCEESKPLSEFYPHRGMTDGHRGKCKVCYCKHVRVFRRDHDSVRARDSRRNKEPVRREFCRSSTAAWRVANPEAYQAQREVQAALRRGDMKREPCEVCGKTGRIHAHHEDYSRPLDVTWLCSRHHSLHHAALNDDLGHIDGPAP